jgi:hypothetical protein
MVMTESLKARLREIKVKCYDGPFYLNDSALSDENIEQIETAYEAEGYVQLPPRITEYDANFRPNIMTGAEFYAAFEKELDGGKSWTSAPTGQTVIPRSTVLQAARRAAGIEEDKL